MSEARDGDTLPRGLQDVGIGVLFDAMLDAVIVSRSDGMIAFGNPAAERLLGYTEREARGMNVDRIVPPELRGRHHAGMQRFGQTGHGELIDARKPIEVPALRKDGERIWVDLMLSRVDHEGRPFAIAILRDVTERVSARDRTDKASKELREAYAGLEAFSGVVGHDLKEPVRAMGVYLEEIAEARDPEERAALVARARGAHRNLQTFLEGLLEWSRTIAAPLDPRELDLAAVLSEPANALQWTPLVTERQAVLRIDGRMPRVRGTESLVVRVFGNLITNAIRHNPKRAPSVTIHAQQPRRGRVAILVDDDGPGFPPEVARALGSELPRSIRTGFGLAIARRAVERLGGTMTIAEGPVGGGRVIVELPAAKMRASTLEERVRDLV